MSAFKTVNPATGETVQTFKDISDQELDQLLDDARDAYLDWRRRPVAERSAVLHAAAEEMRANSAEYAAYVTLEMGKLAGQAEAEVGLSAAVLDYYAARTERFLAPKGLLESPGATVRPEPIGVILAIEPWNFPYYQIARIRRPAARRRQRGHPQARRKRAPVRARVRPSPRESRRSGQASTATYSPRSSRPA